MAFWSGWLAVVALVVAALLPLGHRLRLHRRAAPASPTIRRHVLLGFATSALAFGHTLAVIPALGSPAAAGGGMVALLPAGAAFFLLVAHAGLGLQLRNERLKDRLKKRRAHAVTAILIATAVVIHVIALERAR
jgi:uncharacterized membrane protein